VATCSAAMSRVTMSRETMSRGAMSRGAMRRGAMSHGAMSRVTMSRGAMSRVAMSRLVMNSADVSARSSPKVHVAASAVSNEAAHVAASAVSNEAAHVAASAVAIAIVTWDARWSGIGTAMTRARVPSHVTVRNVATSAVTIATCDARSSGIGTAMKRAKCKKGASHRMGSTAPPKTTNATRKGIVAITTIATIATITTAKRMMASGNAMQATRGLPPDRQSATARANHALGISAKYNGTSVRLTPQGVKWNGTSDQVPSASCHRVRLPWTVK